MPIDDPFRWTGDLFREQDQLDRIVEERDRLLRAATESYRLMQDAVEEAGRAYQPLETAFTHGMARLDNGLEAISSTTSEVRAAMYPGGAMAEAARQAQEVAGTFETAYAEAARIQEEWKQAFHDPLRDLTSRLQDTIDEPRLSQLQLELTGLTRQPFAQVMEGLAPYVDELIESQRQVLEAFAGWQPLPVDTFDAFTATTRWADALQLVGTDDLATIRAELLASASPAGSRWVKAAAAAAADPDAAVEQIDLVLGSLAETRKPRQEAIEADARWDLAAFQDLKQRELLEAAIRENTEEVRAQRLEARLIALLTVVFEVFSNVPDAEAVRWLLARLVFCLELRMI